MYKVSVKVTPRKSILDPQGKAVEHSLKSLGYNSITDTRIGKFIELTVESSSEDEARNTAKEAAGKLLANPVTEDFEIISVSKEEK